MAAAAAGALVGLSFLVIGDSHLATPNYLIEQLPNVLMEQGARVHTIGVCGSMPADWVSKKEGDCGGAERTGEAPAVRSTTNVSTTPVKDLIASDKPSAVIIVSGDNIASYLNPIFPKSWANQQVTTLAKSIGATGTACYWVGPAWGTEGGRYGKNFARVEEVNNFLKDNVAPCVYIDSTNFSGKGEWKTIDGQHFVGKGYKLWSTGIAGYIVQNPPRSAQ